MLKRLRNWWDTRYRPLDEAHFLTKSLILSEYTRIDVHEDFRTRFPQRLDVFRLGGVFAKPIDANLGLFITIRLYYNGNPKDNRCQYFFQWCFGKESTLVELYNLKYASEVFYHDPEHVQQEFNEILPTIQTVILINRLKSHADLVTPVEPSTLTEEQLAQQWEKWHENYENR